MITKDRFDEKLETSVVRTFCNISSGLVTGDEKKVFLNVTYQDITINDLIQATLGQGVKVKFQNGRMGRPNHANLKNDQVFDIDFRAPAKRYSDPVKDVSALMIADGVDMEDGNAVIAWLKGHQK